MKYISYLRVSTKRQGDSGLGLEGQREAVSEFIRGEGGELVEEFVEVESGANNERPVLQDALAYCKLHNQRRTTVKLVIAKLDRLSRSAAFLTALQESNVPFVAADMPQADHFVVGVMALIARWERDKIAERTKSALDAKKRRGETWKRYSPPKGVDNLKEARKRSSAVVKAKAAERAEHYRAIFEKLEAEGHTSHNAKARALNEQAEHGNGIPNPSGESEKWSAMQVSRIAKRLAENTPRGAHLL